MGFYLRKGLNLGLLRINFSKSGVGLSFGVKGLRIGSGPNGNYVHAGRKGIYYKKSLSSLSDLDNQEQFKISWLIMLVLIMAFFVVCFYVKFDGSFDEAKKFILAQIASN